MPLRPRHSIVLAVLFLLCARVNAQLIGALPEPVPSKAVADAQSLAGTWYDSQGNQIKIKALGGSIVLSIPTAYFENSFSIITFKLELMAQFKEGAWQGSQEMQGGSVRMNATVAPSGMIRARFDVPGSSSEPFDFILVRDSGRTPDAKPVGKEPVHVAIDLLQASTAMGKWVPMNVYLADAAGHVIAPEKDTVIRLRVAGGAPVPSLIRLTKDRPVAPAGAVTQVRAATVTAAPESSKDNFAEAHVTAYGCVQGTPVVPKMNALRARADADGRDAIDVTVTLVDDKDTPVTDNDPKQIGFDVEGVARVRSVIGGNASIIPGGQCVNERALVADQAGDATASANFQKVSVHKALIFQPTLTPLLFIMVGAGGLMGGFISAARNFAATNKWKTRRWIYWLVSAVGGALVLYLAYFYGLISFLQKAPNGGGLAMLVGLIGGFLGADAIKRVAGAAVPETSAK